MVYNLNKENEHLQKVEWLYRYERVSYDTEGIRNMMLRERGDDGGQPSGAGQHKRNDYPTRTPQTRRAYPRLFPTLRLLEHRKSGNLLW